MLFRVILLLAIVASLAVFTLSNLQPIALVFLGIQTPALPLSWWVLLAIGAGALTTVVVSILVGLSNYATGRKVRSRFRQATQGSRFQAGSRSSYQDPNPAATAAARAGGKASSKGDADADWNNWDGYEGKKTAQPSAAKDSSLDDWDTAIEDDWETSSSSRSTAKAPEDRSSSSRATDTTGSGIGSDTSYSYGYKDPKSSGAGRRETVVDAEYRVIVPPYRTSEPTPPPPPPPAPPAEENADDWFEDDDAGTGDRDWRR